jgi:hypothetical protein
MGRGPQCLRGVSRDPCCLPVDTGKGMLIRGQVLIALGSLENQAFADIGSTSAYAGLTV